MHLCSSLTTSQGNGLKSFTKKLKPSRQKSYKRHKTRKISANHVNKFQGKTKDYSKATAEIYRELEATEANLSSTV